MKTLELNQTEFKQLEPFHLIEGTLEKESDLYYMPGNKNEIIKVYKNYQNKRYMAEKMATNANLLKYTSELSFPELLTPSGILKVDNEIVGTIYPRIKGYTTRIYFYTFYCPIKVKIEILRKIGTLLEKIKNTNPLYNAAFSDVHVDNFMVTGFPSNNIKNSPNFKIMACDTDSMKLLDTPGITGYYLYDADKLGDYDKYPLDEDGFVIPSSNTDIFCYIMMIFDLISRSEYVYCLNEDEYYRYIDYLDKIGFDSKLLESFASVYDDNIDNISPLPYLDSLSKMSDESTLLSFYKKRRL